MIMKELNRHPELGISVQAIVDDDPGKLNKVVYGVKVVADTTSLPQLITQRNISEVIIAMPSAPGAAIRRVVNLCQDTGVKIKVLPGLYELVDGKLPLASCGRSRRDLLIEIPFA